MSNLAIAPEEQTPLSLDEIAHRKVRVLMIQRGYTNRTLALAIGEKSEAHVGMATACEHVTARIGRKIEKLFKCGIWRTDEEKAAVDHAELVFGMDPLIVSPRTLLGQARALGIILPDADASPAELVEIAAEFPTPATPPPHAMAEKVRLTCGLKAGNENGAATALVNLGGFEMARQQIAEFTGDIGRGMQEAQPLVQEFMRRMGWTRVPAPGSAAAAAMPALPSGPALALPSGAETEEPETAAV